MPKSSNSPMKYLTLRICLAGMQVKYRGLRQILRGCEQPWISDPLGLNSLRGAAQILFTVRMIHREFITRRVKSAKGSSKLQKSGYCLVANSTEISLKYLQFPIHL